LRNVTFENSASTKKERLEFINIQHPLLANIQNELQQRSIYGNVSALRVSINKFKEISGYWFVYRLSISNNNDKQKTSFISIFMEDAEFCNDRISHYLLNHPITTADMIQNFSNNVEIEKLAAAAKAQAEIKAREQFLATQLTWQNELDAHEKKFQDYYHFKENAINKIQIDNIRESKRKALDIEKEERARTFQLQRNVIPKLELFQIAYVEFK